jgi:Brp/Blh family beta-carotene 15,15'-monooxygenase
MPGGVACGAALLLAVAFPEAASRPEIQWTPWAVGLLAFGIPHGALDHQIGMGVGHGVGRVRFLAVYIMLAAAVVALWWLAPMAALVGFLVVAAFHFGQGDLYWHQAAREGIGPNGALLGERRRSWRWQSVSTFVVRGLVPVALPVLIFADEFAGAADAMTGRLFGGSGRWAIPESTRTAALAAVCGLVVVHLGMLLDEAIRRPTHRRLAGVEAGGTILLVGLFTAVPPVLAMGVYFNAWHSVRHVARLLLVAGPTREAARAGRWGEAMARFHVTTLPTSLAALALMGLLGWALHDRVRAATDSGLALLVMVAALTLPHVIVVLGMDRDQAVWGYRRPAGLRP